jgi:hypothetical protein
MVINLPLKKFKKKGKIKYLSKDEVINIYLFISRFMHIGAC